MKITAIEAVRLNQPQRQITTTPWRPHWTDVTEVANPMSRFPEVKANRKMWLPKWQETWVRVTLEDGTVGYGQTSNGRVTAAIIDDYLGPALVGDDVFAQKRLADKLLRLTTPSGSAGLASYAVSAIDLALLGCARQAPGQAGLRTGWWAAEGQDVLLRHRQRCRLVPGTGLPGVQAGLPLWPRRWSGRTAQERGTGGQHPRADR